MEIIENEHRSRKGLEGIIADDTTISKVDTTLNKLIYRGYDINELCDKTSFFRSCLFTTL